MEINIICEQYKTLCKLVVALSLDSSNFSRNMRTINQQIKEAKSTFRLAGAGVQNYEKTIAGTEARLSMPGQKLKAKQRAVEQYIRALVAANDKLKENYTSIRITSSGWSRHGLSGGSSL